MSEGVSGGLTSKEAESIGWLKKDADIWEWTCPFCAGNEDKLDLVFNK